MTVIKNIPKANKLKLNDFCFFQAECQLLNANERRT